MDIALLKRWIRYGLMAVVVAASAGAAWLGLVGTLSWVRVGVLLAVALGCLRSLPRGARPAGWLFAVWVGLALVLLGTVDEVVAWTRMERTPLSIAGGIAFFLLASLALWSCTPGPEEQGRR